MNIQQWVTHLISRPTEEPLDWESYSVTMGDPTWKSLWQDIDAGEAYEDGLEAGLRLLEAARHHRTRLGLREYQGHQVLLYRSILAMLDKADRWDAYLAAWETIWTQARQCLPVKGDALREGGPRLAPFVQRADGGFGIPPLPYGAMPPKTLEVHFLYPQLRRKTLIERKLAQERAGRLTSGRRPVGQGALTGEEIQSRLLRMRDSGEEGTTRLGPGHRAGLGPHSADEPAPPSGPHAST